MATLTIEIPNAYAREVKARARREGFANAAEWARTIIVRNIGLEASPRLSPRKITRSMRKTGLYRETFLRELEKSLAYADHAA